MQAGIVYRTFVQWKEGPGGSREFAKRSEALREAEYLKELGYGKEGRDEIQVWKLTRERIQ